MTVIWTPNAELSFAIELENINKKWTATEVIHFMDLVDNFIEKLESGIIQGKISTITNMRSFVISKQTTLFFNVFEDTQTIALLLFWNNTDNPKKLRKLLNNQVFK